MKQYPVYYQKLGNGETIAYRKAGEGDKTLLLLHGNMSSSVFWQTTMEEIESDIQIIAPDLRGFGDSTYKSTFDSLLDLALDIKQLLEYLKVDKFTVLGWSTGGGVALELAAMLGSQVEKVILLDSVGVYGFTIYKKDDKGKIIIDEVLTKKEDIALDPVQVLPVLDAYANKDKEMLRMIWNATIYQKAQPKEAEYEVYLDAMLKQRNLVDIDYSLVHFKMMVDGKKVEPYTQIKAPVVIMHGRDDNIVPYDEALVMKDYFQDQATLVTFEDVGHSVMTDAFDHWIDVLRETII